MLLDLYSLILYIGVYQVAWWLFRIARVFYRVCFGTEATTERYGEGSWAVVTGSTDGIGKECAKYLARQGFNVVLVSRNLAKLNATAKELQQIGLKNGREVKTRVIALDFTEPNKQRAEVYERVFNENLCDIDISILINNAGYAHVCVFDEVADSHIHQQLMCNTYPVVLLTQQVIKSFQRRFKTVGKRSLLASTSSIAGTQPIPFASTYSASKRFVDFITWALREELADHGVDVCCWKAATVSTKMTKYSKGWLSVTPQAYAQAALSRCQSGANGGAFCHDLIYALVQNLQDVVPLSLVMWVMGSGAKKAADRVKARELGQMAPENIPN